MVKRSTMAMMMLKRTRILSPLVKGKRNKMIAKVSRLVSLYTFTASTDTFGSCITRLLDTA